MSHILGASSQGERRVYQATIDGHSVPKPSRYIKVVFDLDWPKGVEDSEVLLNRRGVMSSIHRTKSHLERSLLAAIEVYDISVGCITVRFSLPPDLDEMDIAVAIHSLWNNRKLYSVCDVSANIDGKAVPLK